MNKEKEAYKMMINEAHKKDKLLWNEEIIVKNITRNKVYWIQESNKVLR